MAFVKVEIYTPNGKGFTASIDADVDPQSLPDELVAQSGLPPRRYELHLLNALKVHDGAVIKTSEYQSSTREKA